MNKKDVRKYMELSIEIMQSSVQEKRDDSKPSPFVGAVLVRPNGEVTTAHRGELREGDHAEFTLIERKCRAEKLDGSVLFATLEPCAPGARHFPKLSCSERIVNARIKKVYIGIEDPDPTVCRKGIKFLQDKGIETEMYPRDLQEIITNCNTEFLSAANERARLAEDKQEIILSETEKIEQTADLSDFSEELLKKFFNRAHLGCRWGDGKCNKVLAQLGMLELEENTYKPTGIGLLLFGKMPQLRYPNARVKATFIHPDGKESIEDFGGSILKQPDAVLSWIKDNIDKKISRASTERKVVYDYPIEVINELTKNAIIHRNYDLEGAPVYVEISNDALVIKSPGEPVKPLSLEQFVSFNAPSLSRNPKMIYVFDIMGLAEQRGFGFKTVRGLKEEYGIPFPLVSYDKPYIVFTLPFTNKSHALEDLSPLELKVWDFIKLHPECKSKEIKEYIDADGKAIERAIKALVTKNKIEKNGAARATTYRAV